MLMLIRVRNTGKKKNIHFAANTSTSNVEKNVNHLNERQEMKRICEKFVRKVIELERKKIELEQLACLVAYFANQFVSPCVPISKKRTFERDSLKRWITLF